MPEKDPLEVKPELTPNMVRAAVKVIAEDYGVCSEYVAEGLVQDIFRAMMAARTNHESSGDHAEVARGNS
jgi:hypothetical protein